MREAQLRLKTCKRSDLAIFGRIAFAQADQPSFSHALAGEYLVTQQTQARVALRPMLAVFSALMPRLEPPAVVSEASHNGFVPLQLEIARRADELAGKFTPGCVSDLALWRQAEREVFVQRGHGNLPILARPIPQRPKAQMTRSNGRSCRWPP